uniref:Methionine synthase reductase n=1 Tax=Heterorhabditis bacteriophora TaxID=37862 RepID=A0A1I7XU96_HETBA
MMNAELLERNFGVQFPEELDGTLDLQNGSANCCKFNRWGTLVAVGSTDGRVFIFDFVTKGIVKTWTAHALPVSSLSWSRDGRKLLTASADTTVAIWDVLQGTAVHKLKFSAMVVSAVFNPRNDNQVLVLQLNYPPSLEELNPRSQRILVNDIPGTVEDGVTAIAFDRRAKYIITGTSKGKLVVYDSSTLRMLSCGKQNSVQQIRQIVIPRRGNFILTNSQDRVIRTYNLDDLLMLQNGATIEPKHRVLDIVNKAAWKAVCTDSEGDYICGASTKAHSLYVWERTTGTLIKILHGTKGESLLDVQWHPTRPVILSVANGMISVWTQAHVENWSAFAPEFTELEENAKYMEREGEFDMEDEDAEEEGKDNEQVRHCITADKQLKQSNNYSSLNNIYTQIVLDSFFLLVACTLFLKDSDEEEIDVVSMRPSELLCSSDEEDIANLLPDITLKKGPLWFLPITPEIENPEVNPAAFMGKTLLGIIFLLVYSLYEMPTLFVDVRRPSSQLTGGMEEDSRKRMAPGAKPGPKGHMSVDGDFLIAYGSQTGQAESIAKQIKERTEQLGLKPRLFTLDDNEKQFHIEKERFIVIVVSSTGDGDAPENAARFVRRISRRTLEVNFLHGLNYALLGAVFVSACSIIGMVSFRTCEIHRIFNLNVSLGSFRCVSLFNLAILFPYNVFFVILGNEKLSVDENLRVPIAPQPFLASTVSHEKLDSEHGIPWQNACKMVGIASAPYVVTVVGTAIVTDPDVPKPKREIIIDIGEHFSELPYEPGDAFYFITPNPTHEVNYLLHRMGILPLADQKCTVSVDPTTQKINATIPGHIPPNSSLRYLFTHCLDIRRAPGRPLLRVLAENASDSSERRRLLELCSAQGMNEFTIFIRQAGLSVADVLFAFPSVKPPVDRLIGEIYRLPTSMYDYVTCIIHVFYFRYPRKGLASEWLSNLHVGDKIQMMRKEPARFRLPPPPAPPSSASQIPLLMVGPGTGVAVFLAFCQHLLKNKLFEPKNFPIVPRYLFFGCRNLEKDALYKDELESYVREGVLTELVFCESRGDGARPKYVQDALRQKTKEVCDFLLLNDESNPSRIFICGDAKGMSKDVWQCFHDIIKDGMSRDYPVMSAVVCGKSSRKMASHPSYSSMIKGAISNLKERSGSSKIAILKYILLNYNLGQNIIQVNAHLRQALKRGIVKGELKLVKGTNVSGSFRLVEKSMTIKNVVKRSSAIKPGGNKIVTPTTKSNAENKSIDLKATTKLKAEKKSSTNFKTPKAKKGSTKTKTKEA